MELQEYKDKKKELEVKHTKELSELGREYAIADNTVAVGDIVEDHIGRVKVEKVLISLGGGDEVPCCVYRGVEITKQGKPFKSGSVRVVWQRNLV